MEPTAEEVGAIFGSRVRSGDLVQQVIYKPVASATREVVRVTHGDRSAVAKVLAPPPEHASGAWAADRDSAGPYYWRREALVYQSGLLADPPQGIRAPACLGVFDRPDGTVSLWLEDVRGGTGGTNFGAEDHAAVLRRLGRWQVRWAGLPEGHGFLARRWLETYVNRHSSDVGLLSDSAVVAGVAHWVDRALVDGILGIWQEQQTFLRWALNGPVTLGHHDLSPKNLFRLPGGFVLIDWAFAGHAGFGVDAGPFGINAAADFLIAPADLAAVGDLLVESYMAGLQEEGWSGDQTVLQLSLAASAAIKFAWLLPAICLGSISDWPSFNGKPSQQGMAWWAAILPEVLRQADTARSLA